MTKHTTTNYLDIFIKILLKINIYSRNRKSFLNKLFNINCNKICIVFNVDIDKCKLRNSTRERKVPEKVIDKMYNKMELPSIEEGFDEIYYINT